MNAIWLRALVLVLIFAAVVLASEVLVRWFAVNRTENKAIQWRLKVIGRGRDPNRPASALRRVQSSIPEGLPEPFHGMAEALERLLFQARFAIEIPRLVLLLVLAPLAIFFGFLLLMLGGLIALAFIIGRRVVRRENRARKHDAKLPYGLAIVAGAFFILGTQATHKASNPFIEKLRAAELARQNQGS